MVRFSTLQSEKFRTCASPPRYHMYLHSSDLVANALPLLVSARFSMFMWLRVGSWQHCHGGRNLLWVWYYHQTKHDGKLLTYSYMLFLALLVPYCPAVICNMIWDVTPSSFACLLLLASALFLHNEIRILLGEDWSSSSRWCSMADGNTLYVPAEKDESFEVYCWIMNYLYRKQIAACIGVTHVWIIHQAGAISLRRKDSCHNKNDHRWITSSPSPRKFVFMAGIGIAEYMYTWSKIGSKLRKKLAWW